MMPSLSDAALLVVRIRRVVADRQGDADSARRPGDHAGSRRRPRASVRHLVIATSFAALVGVADPDRRACRR